MTSLVTQMIVAERYGLRVGAPQLAELLGLSKGALYNQISSGRFAIPTYLDAGKRWADYRDVANYLDKCRQTARAEVQP